MSSTVDIAFFRAVTLCVMPSGGKRPGQSADTPSRQCSLGHVYSKELLACSAACARFWSVPEGLKSGRPRFSGTACIFAIARKSSEPQHPHSAKNKVPRLNPKGCYEL